MRLTRWGRFLAGLLALAAAATLGAAAYLTPNSAGIGTHTGLGFQSCAFEYRTGLPCLTCGMTTSFAWFVRGHIAASFYLQPMGCVLALLTTMTLWAAGYIALTGRPAHNLLNRLPMGKIAFGLFLFAILAWMWKIYIHLKGLDGWRY